MSREDQGPRQQSMPRPSTLADSWRRMNQPRKPTPHGLPVLPDWPPLPEVPAQAHVPNDEWSPGAAAWQDAIPPLPSAKGLPRDPPRAVWLRRPSNIVRRLRNAPKRTQLGITAAAVIIALLIAGTASFALHIAGTATPRNTTFVPQGGSSIPQAAGSTGTPTVLPTGTPDSQSAPTPTSSTPSISLTFTCASGTLRGTGQVCIHTLPQAALTITVRYCDGTTARGLRGNAFADTSGNYTWTWSVRTSCAGTATATVTAKWNGQSITSADPFTITK